MRSVGIERDKFSWTGYRESTILSLVVVTAILAGYSPLAVIPIESVASVRSSFPIHWTTCRYTAIAQRLRHKECSDSVSIVMTRSSESTSNRLSGFNGVSFLIYETRTEYGRNYEQMSTDSDLFAKYYEQVRQELGATTQRVSFRPRINCF